MEAEEIDSEVRKIADECDYKFDQTLAVCPPRSNGWWQYIGDVLAVACNTRKITMERRNELLDAAYGAYKRLPPTQ